MILPNNSNDSPEVSVIIVNYNGKDILKKSLTALFATSKDISLEVILVDNNSQDDSLAKIKEFENQIILIKNQENTGFGKANNQGLKLAKGKYILLLNNDALLHENALKEMVKFIKENKNCGVVCPKLLNLDGSLQIHGSSLGKLFFKTEKPQAKSFLPAAVFLIRTDLFREIGGFDENFFFYNEDLDLCKNIIKKGFKLYYLPTVSATHIGGFSSKNLKEEGIVEGFRGGLYFCKKHYGVLVYTLYKGILKPYLHLAIFWLSIFAKSNEDKIKIKNAYKKILEII